MGKQRPIVLIGYMGSGKSTLGRKAARAMHRLFLDTDAQIEREQGCTIAELFAAKGEAYFRQCETALLQRLLLEQEETGEGETAKAEQTAGALILATGGGMPVQPQNADLLRRLGTVVYLKAAPDTLYERLAGDTKRPLLSDGDLRGKIEQMLRERGPVYEALADVTLETDRLSFYEMIRVLERLETGENGNQYGKEWDRT